MLDVRRMQVLRAVVTSGSVTAAATNLGYTPSAISQQIAALEKQAGLALLERVGRGVQPTAAGRLLTEHAATISQNLAEAETALADLRDGRTGRLAIRYFATAGAALVPPALAKLRRDHPGVQVDLKLIDPESPLPEVESGRADLAIVVHPRQGPLRGGVRLIHLLDDPYRAVLPRGHRLASKRVLDLVDLADEPWIGNEWPAGPCLQVMFDACAAAGFSPNLVVESEDYTTAQGFVAAGLGISVIPQMGLGSRHPGVVVRKLRRPEPIRAIHAAVRESSMSQPALRDLIEALREAAESR
ncbi:DNA-binding transcriptional regulator, LysR family [Actinokineospora alba]|uniref:DNA-binding transcriptional regulator, LysR family n=1 Tax=Actinokineospora alba TaxID=504798 RepID=A0A1H0WJZ4_9PSEU|nr:LysR family transcriptional regulator [Actinokineospora alba]SDH61757.1 DNA-binding transcriptional regulator, LysR family [Actinokineospora alba]SDP90938.1 DNA-binding transcriptional regulator, LysR family [Actinokineospora alba]